MEFAPFARDQLTRLPISPDEVRRVVSDAVVIIPLAGGKALCEGMVGESVVSVIVTTRSPRTVVSVVTRRL